MCFLKNTVKKFLKYIKWQIITISLVQTLKSLLSLSGNTIARTGKNVFRSRTGWDHLLLISHSPSKWPQVCFSASLPKYTFPSYVVLSASVYLEWSGSVCCRLTLTSCYFGEKGFLISVSQLPCTLIGSLSPFTSTAEIAQWLRSLLHPADFFS